MQNVNWKHHLKVVGILLVLQLLIDFLYVYLYPTVNPIRATLIGATAFGILWIPQLRSIVKLRPVIAFLPIFVNALLGALAVQAQIVSSKSLLSAFLHVTILIIMYAIIVVVKKK